MKRKDTMEKKELRRLTDEELEQVTGGRVAGIEEGCIVLDVDCTIPGQHFDFNTCKCVD